METFTLLFEKLRQKTGIAPSDVLSMVVSGNTTMIHFLLGLDPFCVFSSPYAVRADRVGFLPAKEMGFPMKGCVYCVPGKSNYLGGDILSGMIATELYKKETISVFFDIGTNGELVVGNREFLLCGAGAAGLAIIRLLIAMGLDPHHVILCDRHGAIYEGRDDLNPQKEEMAKITNSGHKAGTLAEMLVDADVFIGVSAPHCVTPEMVKSMAKDPIIFAMANPTPEIMPDEALAAGAAVMGTGRSDFPNQINNVLAFPGIFRGALDVRASDINDAMKIAAAKAIADFVTPEKLSAEYIIPSPLEEGVSAAVAKAVAQAAKDTGVARV